ncbi:MAG TPA: MaoC/PaaZ C-terminal domain-containing protein [Acidimicrobiales bacterium]|nr:MaoC/PaaZ C-terminal domain-containing protein [Acidimicrobiales bacterium]
MTLATDRLGTIYTGRPLTVDPDGARAFAAATNDDDPAYRSGGCVPPVFGAVLAWDALAMAVTDVVPAEALAGLVHGEHDMHFSAPLVPGTSVTSRAQPHSVRPGRSGTRLTVRLRTTDSGTGAPMLEQYATVLVRGWWQGEERGPDKPDHAMPPVGERHEVGRRHVGIDADQTYRYRDAAGDANPIHVDDEAARRAGLPGIVLHGLCTMAMAGGAVLRTVGCPDPRLLRRLAVRFSGWVRPETELVVSTYAMGGAHRPARGPGLSRDHAFEAHSDGRLVVADGRAALEG